MRNFGKNSPNNYLSNWEVISERIFKVNAEQNPKRTAEGWAEGLLEVITEAIFEWIFKGIDEWVFITFWEAIAKIVLKEL